MTPHDEKFAEFNRMIELAKQDEIDMVMVHHPEVLGDDYDELITNLNKIADAELTLCIIPSSSRGRSA